MRKSDIKQMPKFFDRYINLVEDLELMEAFKLHQNCPIEKNILLELANQRYAENKWTVKDILQHIIDTERIMAYRALRFSRNDKTPLSGYEESLYGQYANASVRTIDDLLEEFRIVRKSNILLYQHLDSEMLQRSGSANNIHISVLSLGFMIIGHPIHHWNVIRERYFPLLKK